METENTTVETAPQNRDIVKQEVVKDDGRLLIFYTFPAGGNDAPEDGETPHV